MYIYVCMYHVDVCIMYGCALEFFYLSSFQMELTHQEEQLFTNRPYEFSSVDSYFRWNHHVSAWKTPISNEETYIFRKFWLFIACDFMSIMKIDEEGHNTFTYACITLLPRVMRENSYINHANIIKVHFRWFSQLVTTKLTSQNKFPLNAFAKGLVEKLCCLFICFVCMCCIVSLIWEIKIHVCGCSRKIIICIQ